MDTGRKNVLVLAICQALLVTSNVVLFSINGLAGHALAAHKALATLPVTTFVLGGALSTMPVSLLMQRLGRVRGFSVGACFGMAGSALSAWAVQAEAFWLLCAGNLLCGVANASAGYYRFAAADGAGTVGKERAISLVLAGGLLGGVLGPQTASLTHQLLARPFLGSYAALIVLALAALALVQTLDIPPLAHDPRAGGGRPLRALVSQPAFLVAVFSAAVAFAVMNLLMTATPLAMQACHHAPADSAFVVGWHVIGMYAPSFFTGSLIRRFGVLEVMLAGAGLMFACVAIALSHESIAAFWSALVLLGIGWNFLYVGGTTLLTESYQPAEQARAQGLNDLVIFSSMAVSSLNAGLLVNAAGWRVVNLASLPFLALACCAALGLRSRRARGRPARAVDAAPDAT